MILSRTAKTLLADENILNFLKLTQYCHFFPSKKSNENNFVNMNKYLIHCTLNF